MGRRDRLEQESANLRAVLQWTVERAEAEIELRLSGALGQFWLARGHYREGHQWLKAALALGGMQPAALRANAR